MTPDGVTVATMIILLFPMGYFLLSSPAFLLVKLDIRPVALLLRGQFNAYFLMLSVVGAIGTVVFVVTGRFAFAIGPALIAAFAIWGRLWFLRQMDDQLSAGGAGDANAARRLRWLHWGGMLTNAVLVVALVTSIPYVAPST
ncbi:hypothetical protein [Bradyrhizobium neotropicale]|uniref:DUF4149 domain-containing protein n=1 Tax=Bradyrhizobium neotropicale TaxID=1497615 RepID=A0A176ZFK4_9BRAD|nr:hypothetical protein [Bradyrhizobium neotropicale]OAF18555.1 hypothetical protein AXW67_03300 [Bradyrhizobium neotropicale]